MATKSIKVSLVNHTHWDREWYFSDQDSLVLSDVLFTRALNELSAHPEASFVLDGQVSVLEDYLQANPEQRELVTRLTQNGQLKVGPWYTQPDALHLQGESLLRNGMVGALLTRKYGPRMEVGYLPDTFGFNAQMPVILSQLALNRFLFWRGIDPAKTGGFYFNWQSLSGSKTVNAVDMPQGYGTGMLMEPTVKYVHNRVDAGADFIRTHTPGAVKPAHVLIPVGNDQMNIVHGISDQIAAISKLGKNEYQLDTYEHFFASLDFDSLPTYQGELVDPVFARVHRSCGSSRMDVKLAATRLEHKLLHEVEPAMVIAQQTGVELSNGLLVHAWKKLLESQAHDSMAGSVVDSVNADILHRLKQGEEIADGILNTIQKLLSLKLGLTDTQVLILNPLPRKRVDWFDVSVLTTASDVQFEGVRAQRLVSCKQTPAREQVLIETAAGSEMGTEPAYNELHYRVQAELPGLGYRVLNFAPVTQMPGAASAATTSTVIGTDKWQLQFVDGKLRVHDADWRLNGEIFLVDDANAGDTYDFSPVAGDQPVRFSATGARIDGNAQTMTVEFDQELPADKLEPAGQIVQQAVQLVASVTESGLLKLKLSLTNRVKNHRLRLMIDTGLHSVASNTASVPFGFIRRDEKQAPDDWNTHYPEKPVDVHPLDNNVTVANADQSWTVFTRDVKEYATKRGVIGLTLLATTDQLGKPNLINRPGRASGDTTKAGHPLIPTPAAELLGTNLNYTFWIQLASSFSEQAINQTQEELDFAPVAYQPQTLNLFRNRLDNKLQDDLVARDTALPNKQGYLNLQNADMVSAVYPRLFGGSGYVVRLANRTQSAHALTADQQERVINALEQPVAEVSEVPSYDVVSLAY